MGSLLPGEPAVLEGHLAVLAEARVGDGRLGRLFLDSSLVAKGELGAWVDDEPALAFRDMPARVGPLHPCLGDHGCDRIPDQRVTPWSCWAAPIAEGMFVPSAVGWREVQARRARFPGG